MKTLFLLLAAILAVQELPAQTASDIHGSVVQDSGDSFAPLRLFTDGGGRIVPYQDGQMLETGRGYVMVAIPNRGFAFSSWQPVTVFTFIEYSRGPSGTLVERTTMDVIRTPEYIQERVLKFTMEPENVLLDVPTVREITVNFGWQANFVPESRPTHYLYRR